MATWDVLPFAEKFIPDRIQFFKKDMAVCLRTFHKKPFKGAHAYFPGLICCCATLDFLGQLQSGCYDAPGNAHVKAFIKHYMDGKVYGEQKVDVLWYALRNKVGHMAHPDWIFDTQTNLKRKKKGPFSNHMRITWIVSERRTIRWKGATYPHMGLLSKTGPIVSPIRPYDLQYDHIISISLRQFKNDIVAAMRKYLRALRRDSALQQDFKTVVEYLFPT